MVVGIVPSSPSVLLCPPLFTREVRLSRSSHFGRKQSQRHIEVLSAGGSFVYSVEMAGSVISDVFSARATDVIADP